MSRGSQSGPVRGSGPDGRIEIDDIRSKLAELAGGVDDATAAARPYLTYLAVGGVVALVALSFLVGRRFGRTTATWVEIKRV
ncbi:MAG: hypothetical protein M0T80_10085 [Actinomycetota bacterium]|nr:hypothetical protein [Actinomycetota bacterium]